MTLVRIAVRLAAVFALASVVVNVYPAQALTVSDGKETSYATDLRSVTLKRSSAPHRLVWTTRTWGAWKSKALRVTNNLDLSLDVTGTSAADYVVEVYSDFTFNSLYCELQRPSGKVIRQAHVSRPDDRSVTCSFSTEGLHLERLRWRASIHWSLVGDVAPNSDWARGA